MTITIIQINTVSQKRVKSMGILETKRSNMNFDYQKLRLHALVMYYNFKKLN